MLCILAKVRASPLLQAGGGVVKPVLNGEEEEAGGSASENSRL